MKKISICLICYKPEIIWIEFLSKFTKYDIYMIIDDNSKDYKEEYSKFNNINIIQIDDEECKKYGFSNMNFTIKKDVTGWDKSVYYFSTINTKYDNIWMLEEDVFFYDETTLLQIDSKYDKSDLLSREFNNTYNGEEKNFWHWNNININLQPPYYRCMVCGIRVSQNLLYKIRNYANNNKKLFSLEALFPTLCKKYNMTHNAPSELKNIIFRNDYEDSDINENDLFHPVKDITKHKYYRDILKKKIFTPEL
jgi:hypothetical protein